MFCEFWPFGTYDPDKHVSDVFDASRVIRVATDQMHFTLLNIALCLFKILTNFTLLVYRIRRTEMTLSTPPIT